MPASSETPVGAHCSSAGLTTGTGTLRGNSATAGAEASSASATEGTCSLTAGFARSLTNPTTWLRVG